MQCELLGAADAEHIQVLIDLLTGLSSHPGNQIHQQELTIKSQVSPFTELKLLQQIPEGKAAGLRRWEICHDGIPVKGKGYAELPAVVRTRTKADVHGNHSLSFWIHLGFSVIYELRRKGFSYSVYHDGFELQVLLCSVGPASSSLQQCEAQIRHVCKAYWLVKITAAVPEAQAVQAAHAIGKQ
ncbi:hypothetical protein ABBQ32_001970 [Trebouxia sp. C0010 RCD-2024]